MQLQVKHVTAHEAKKEIYKLSFKIWIVLSFIVVILFYLISYLLPKYGIIFSSPLSKDLEIYFSVLLIICMYPISVANAYKIWIYRDASKIWSDPDSKLMKIRENLYDDVMRDPFYRRMWYMTNIDFDDRYSSSLIFPIYLRERENAIKEIMSSGKIIDNIDGKKWSTLTARPISIKEILIIIVFILIALFTIKQCIPQENTSKFCSFFGNANDDPV